MVRCKSITRFFKLNKPIILTQTDTTVGFLSQNESKLQSIKSRSTHKPFIKVYKNFAALKENKIRVPNSQKRRVRASSKTTFIVKGMAFRVSSDFLDSSFLRNTKWNYSPSANERVKNFDRNFCEEKTDIIVENRDPLHEGDSSSLYKINTKKLKRLR